MRAMILSNHSASLHFIVAVAKKAICSRPLGIDPLYDPGTGLFDRSIIKASHDTTGREALDSSSVGFVYRQKGLGGPLPTSLQGSSLGLSQLLTQLQAQKPGLLMV